MLNDIINLLDNNNYNLIGITGGAGAGKSTLASNLPYDIYHIDSGFIGDSEYRKNLLIEKSKTLGSMLDAYNQYNWWNWAKIEEEVFEIKARVDKLVVEGALLGDEFLLDHFDIILFIIDEPQHRFSKLVNRDSYKRSFSELLERFLITEYSESMYYKYMIEKYYDKIVPIDYSYNFLSYLPEINNEQILPMKVRI